MPYDYKSPTEIIKVCKYIINEIKLEITFLYLKLKYL